MFRMFVYLFVVYLTTLFSDSDNRASNEVIVNDELERIWKEAVVA
jgi:hypothetical protein